MSDDLRRRAFLFSRKTTNRASACGVGRSYLSGKIIEKQLANIQTAFMVSGMNQFKYFSGATELQISFPMKREIVRNKFPTGTIKRFDSFDLQVGTVDGRYDRENFLPVTRIVCFNPNGSAHKCDSRCRCAKGGDCECSCGGKFHGIDRAG